MTRQPQIKCLLWDFGDTLCDERFIWSSGPEWMEVYATFDHDGLGTAWSLGHINMERFANELAKRLDHPPDSIIAHMIERCHHIRFFDWTYAFFKARHLPQAIVTVNPDIFSDVIVPICHLHLHCDAIITSWEEGTDDKRVLNERAVQRLGIACDNRSALLIDNKRKNVDEWIAVGGSGYHFQGDETFARDVENGIESLAESAKRGQPGVGTG